MQSIGCPRPQCSSPSPEDIPVMNNIILTHDPDGRRVDSESLLRMMENVMYYATTSNVSGSNLPAIAVENFCTTAGVVGSNESVGNTIYRISREILCKCCGDGDLQARTTAVFELLGSYSWDAKVVLVLVAFAANYGEFWLIMQLCPLNPLAVSVAMLKQLPSDLGTFKRRFKALTLLVKTMLSVTKCVIEFEGLPLQHVKLDDEAMIATRSQIYRAAYWVIRSALTCSSQITDLMAAKHELLHSTSTAIATWELSSLVSRVSHVHDKLRRQVDLCHNQIEAKLNKKLSNLFMEIHVDNQEVLRLLFALDDDFPLKHGYSQAKVAVSELINKEVILFLSKPKMNSLENLLLLVQQTYDHPDQQNELERQYEIIWVPVPCSSRWTDAEEKEYHKVSNAFPWYSVNRPWRLSAAIVNYMRREWHFMEEPLMVVLDRQGRVTSSNAIDMILIWGGPKAYPFSAARELQLWEEASWSLQLLVNEINPLMSYWVNERRTLCLYGSDDIGWIREFTTLMMEIKIAGLQLEMVYVGKRDIDEHMRNILDTIAEGKLGGYLSYPNIHFFWLRLESMQRSKLRLGRTSDVDIVMKEVESLLSPNASVDGWAVMGEGSSTDVIKLQGRQLIECLKLFQRWGNDIEKLGFLGAIRNSLEPQPPPAVKQCSNRSSIIPYVEGLTQGTAFCEECKRPMEKHILYQCLVTE